MGTVVSQCAADGASTGGVYNPVGSGASEFTVKVNCTSDSAKCASESASVTFNSSNANVNKRDSIQCFVKAAMPDRPSVPTTFAIDAVENFCKDQDGKFYNEGDQYIILYTWYVPNQELSILAHRSATIWEADCQRAFDPVLRQCSSSDWQSFTGGLNDQVPIQYSLDVRNPVDASSSVEAGGNVAARSPENADTGNFNASDSTFSKFSTTCDSLPSSGGLTIPSRNTFSAIDQFCAFVDGKPLVSKIMRGCQAVSQARKHNSQCLGSGRLSLRRFSVGDPALTWPGILTLPPNLLGILVLTVGRQRANKTTCPLNPRSSRTQ